MDNTTIGSLDSLKYGDTLLVSARKVKNDKILETYKEKTSHYVKPSVKRKLKQKKARKAREKALKREQRERRRAERDRRRASGGAQ